MGEDNPLSLITQGGVNMVDNIKILIPILLLEGILLLTSLIHVLKHPNYKFGNKIMWIFIVVFIQIIGPIVYFTIGRGED